MNYTGKISVNWWPEACNFIKKRLWHRCFPLSFAEFLRTPFLIEQLWWLLLYLIDFLLNPPDIHTDMQMNRSSRSQMFFKKHVLKNFAIFTGKALKVCNFIKKGFQHVFSCEYCEIFNDSPFLQNTSSGCLCMNNTSIHRSTQTYSKVYLGV